MRPALRGGRSWGSSSARANPALRGREVSQMPVGPDARPGARTDTADPILSPVVSDAARRSGEAGLPSHAVPRSATLPPDSLRIRFSEADLLRRHVSPANQRTLRGGLRPFPDQNVSCR